MKQGDKIKINLPKSYEFDHAGYYSAFQGREGVVSKIWNLKGMLFEPKKGDMYSVVVKLPKIGKEEQYVHIPISNCQRIQ